MAGSRAGDRFPAGGADYGTVAYGGPGQRGTGDLDGDDAVGGDDAYGDYAAKDVVEDVVKHVGGDYVVEDVVKNAYGDYVVADSVKDVGGDYVVEDVVKNAYGDYVVADTVKDVDGDYDVEEEDVEDEDDLEDEDGVDLEDEDGVDLEDEDDLEEAADEDDIVDAWHWALLQLAGILPDELVSRARGWLAAGQRANLARAVAFALVAARAAVPDEIDDLLWEELGESETDVDLLDLLSELETLPEDEELPVPWRFCSADPATAGSSPGLPLDLTVRNGTPGPGDVERAIVEAARDERDTVGLWRAWRIPAGNTPWPPPRRLFVVTVQRGAELAAVTWRLQAALAAAGEPDPAVEVYPAGAEAPAYQALARTSGALLWAREPAVDISVARVFDEVDAVHGPRFDPDRHSVDAADRERVAAYLSAGVPVLGTSATMVDIVDPGRGDVVPLSLRTDGQWVWSDTVSYYFNTYGLAPDPDLLRHVELHEPPVWVDEVALHRVLARLLSPERAEAQAAWYVPDMGADTAEVAGP
jgi:hypothetical protein